MQTSVGHFILLSSDSSGWCDGSLFSSSKFQPTRVAPPAQLAEPEERNYVLGNLDTTHKQLVLIILCLGPVTIFHQCPFRKKGIPESATSSPRHQNCPHSVFQYQVHQEASSSICRLRVQVLTEIIFSGCLSGMGWQSFAKPGYCFVNSFVPLMKIWKGPLDILLSAGQRSHLRHKLFFYSRSWISGC